MALSAGIHPAWGGLYPRCPTVWFLTLRAPDTRREHAATGPLPWPVQNRRRTKAACLS